MANKGSSNSKVKSSKSVKSVSKNPKKTTKVVEAPVESSSTNFSIPGVGVLPESFQNKWPYLVAGVVGLALVVYLLSRFLVVAWVDGKPVTRISLYQNLEKRYGKDAREQLIVEQLVDSEAQKRKISITADEVNAEVTKTQEKYGGADQFNQLLQGQNVTLEEVKSQLRLQLLMNKMFGESINISDDELNKYIEDNKEALSLDEKEASEVAKIKEDTKNDLKQQKINEEIGKWIDEALKSSRVSRV